MKLTVYHDGQYWVGIFEETSERRLKACKYTFGSEPADQEVLDLVNTQMLGMLAGISETVDTKIPGRYRKSPKRLAREAAKELQRKGVTTAAQAAIQLEREKQKTIHKQVSREERELFQRKKRELAVLKAKAKHRGH